MYSIDYSKMEWDPTVKKPLANVYPKIKEVFGDKFNDKDLRYILLMYDVKSPLKNDYPDLNMRKSIAFTQAGYDLDKDSEKFSQLSSLTIAITEKQFDRDGEYIGDITTIKPYEELLELISIFVRYQNNRVWTMIITNENAFYEYQKRIMAEIGGDADKDALTAITIKTKLMESMNDIHQRLEKYYRELYGEDESLIGLSTKRKRLSAEGQAVR